jgi:signal recognition particle subunit SRP54
MMDEIRALHEAVKPIETLFVVDAMLGQDAVNTAKAFKDALPLTGVVLTKLDGDARGGAALSVRHVTGKPLKFAGVGEKLSGLEEFHPQRMASESSAWATSSVWWRMRAVRSMKTRRASLPRSSRAARASTSTTSSSRSRRCARWAAVCLMDKLPAQFAGAAQQLQGGQDEKAIKRIEGIINSMTPTERTKPELIKASRKRRIAAGSGTSVQEVNRLLNQFEQTQKMMKQFSRAACRR